MDDWLLEERQKLLRLGIRSFIKAGAVTLVVVLALLAGMLLALDELELDPATANAVLMGAAVVIPVIAFFLVDWLRRRFWLRAIGNHARRLRAVQFLNNYADAVDESRLNELPAGAREQVQQVLEREREGILPPEREYALAIQPLIALDPEVPAGRGGSGKRRAGHRHRATRTSEHKE